jgi:mono/diheme cytochrome c family protein
MAHVPAGIAFLAALLLCRPVFAAAADAAQIERGRYLTHDVAMCVHCHSPRDANGALIDGKEFTGAPFPLFPPAYIRVEDWCVVTPPIAGLPSFTPEEAVRFFMNGARDATHQPKWPMPPYRMSRDDAEAVVAYLESIARGERSRP